MEPVSTTLREKVESARASAVEITTKKCECLYLCVRTVTDRE